jgi:Cft2 family RNA processing exonuclease
LLDFHTGQPDVTPLIGMDRDYIKLKDSILTLDARSSKSLSFISSYFTGRPDKNQQFMSTEATLRLLGYEQNPATALVCEYNHPFAVGRLKLEFLPSGLILGSSSLYVEYDDQSILYAPHLVLQKSKLLRQVQLKAAKTLILGAFEPTPKKGTRLFNKDQFTDVVNRYLRMGIYPIVLCSPYGTAQEILAHLLSEGFPVKLHPKLHEIMKIYKKFGTELPRYYLTSAEREGITLTHKVIHHPKHPVIHIEDHSSFNPDRYDFRDVDERFCYSSKIDGKDFKDIYSMVQPEEIYLFGPYAKNIYKDARALCDKVSILNPYNQPALF